MLCSTVARRCALSAACAAVLLFTQCGPRDAKYNPSNFTIKGPIVPAEALVPAGALPGDEIDGVYVAGGDATSCCFISPHATLSVRKPRPASRLCIGVYVPPVGPFVQRPQALTAHLVGSPIALRFGNLHGGQDYRCELIPGRLRNVNGPMEVRLDSDIDYVPAQAGTGGDTEHYALVLISIYFD